MKRTLIQLDEEIYRRLRQRAFREERSISSLVRELIADGLDGKTRRELPARATQLASVRSGRSRQTGSSPVSVDHDAALATAIKK
jgi:plasmid stability protein